jgi:hypothetical protein
MGPRTEGGKVVEYRKSQTVIASLSLFNFSEMIESEVRYGHTPTAVSDHSADTTSLNYRHGVLLKKCYANRMVVSSGGSNARA